LEELSRTKKEKKKKQTIEILLSAFSKGDSIDFTSSFVFMQGEKKGFY
jgi:hypothetical protein